VADIAGHFPLLAALDPPDTRIAAYPAEQQTLVDILEASVRPHHIFERPPAGL